jgi:hypothetical protein
VENIGFGLLVVMFAAAFWLRVLTKVDKEGAVKAAATKKVVSWLTRLFK